jgi:hypothetical protein
MKENSHAAACRYLMTNRIHNPKGFLPIPTYLKG